MPPRRPWPRLTRVTRWASSLEGRGSSDTCSKSYPVVSFPQSRDHLLAAQPPLSPVSYPSGLTDPCAHRPSHDVVWLGPRPHAGLSGTQSSLMRGPLACFPRGFLLPCPEGSGKVEMLALWSSGAASLVPGIHSPWLAHPWLDEAAKPTLVPAGPTSTSLAGVVTVVSVVHARPPNPYLPHQASHWRRL